MNSLLSTVSRQAVSIHPLLSNTQDYTDCKEQSSDAKDHFFL